MIRLASFDVFDSVLLRDALVPSDVFPRIGRRLVPGGSANEAAVRDFAAARVRAEIAARAASAREDVSLEEIWRELCRTLGWEWSERFAQAEMDEEARSLAPAEPTRRLVEDARRAYGRVIFISDSYFPARFLEEQLRRFELMRPSDRLYVSCEAGLTKSSGNLFRHVLESERIAPGELRHYGDHPRSDVKVPSSLGIAATRVRVPDLDGTERELAEGPLSSLASMRDMVGASRQFRQAVAPGADEAGAFEAAGAFLGPFCALFAAWTLERARQDGVRRLYFCARDCQMAWKAARILAPRIGDIDCRYLHISRQALFLPSIRAADRIELHWMRRPYEEPMLARVLAKVEIEPGEWRDELRGIGSDGPGATGLRDERDWDRLWSALEREPLRSAILRKAEERRGAATEYFRAQGLLEDAPFGIVDIGWHLTCQASLRAILSMARGSEPPLRGYYVQLNVDRASPGLAGPAESLFAEPAADLGHVGARVGLNHLHSFLEHVVGQATEGSTQAYAADMRGEAQPVFSPATIADAERAAIQRHHDAVEAYVRRYAPRIAEWARDTTTLPLLLHAIAEAFYRNAGDGAVASLAHIRVAVDQNSLDLRPLMRPLSLWDAIRPIFPARLFPAAARTDPPVWPRAGEVANSPLKNAIHGAARGAARIRSRLWRNLVRSQ
jgi:FMN phosphatase YigB (HAD superfamily)